MRKWILPPYFVILAFFLILLPVCFVAVKDYSELYTISSDQPIMVRAFFDLVSGVSPNYTPYGLSQCVVLWLILAPISMAASLLGTPLSFSFYTVSLHIAQLLASCGVLLMIFKTTERYASRSWALLALILSTGCYAFYYWTIILKPDVWMVFFLLLTCWFLDESCVYVGQKRFNQSRASLFLAATFFGFALGSKIWAMFLIPAIVFAMIVFIRVHYQSNQLNVGLKAALLAVVFALISNFLAMPHFYLHVKEISAVFQMYGDQVNTLPLMDAISLLFLQKLQLLTSWQYGGPWIFISFVIFAPVLLIKAYRTRTIAGLYTSVPFSLIGYILVFLFYQIFFARDSFNVIGGDRNILSIMMPAIVFVGIGLKFSWEHKLLGVRTLGVFLVLILLVHFFAQVGLGIVFHWQPYPRVIHEGLHKQVTKNLSPEKFAVFNSLYISKDDPNNYILKTNLSPTDAEQVLVLNEELKLFSRPHWHVNSESQIWKFAMTFRSRSEGPDFKVRDWFRDNAKANSTILTEFYVNLLQNECFAPTSDLPSVSKIWTVHWTKMVITKEEIEMYRPDYLVTRYRNLATQIEREIGGYRIIKNFDDKIVILKKTN